MARRKQTAYVPTVAAAEPGGNTADSRSLYGNMA